MIAEAVSCETGVPALIIEREEGRELEVFAVAPAAVIERALTTSQPGLVVLARPLLVGRLCLRGSDGDALDALSGEVSRHFASLGLLASSLAPGHVPELRIAIDRERAARYGVSALDVARTIALAGGAPMSRSSRSRPASRSRSNGSSTERLGSCAIERLRSARVYTGRSAARDCAGKSSYRIAGPVVRA